MTAMNQIITEQLLKWPHVTQQPHRFGGIEFLFKGKEIGHLHGNGLADILLPRSLRDQFIASGRAQPHHIYPSSSWVSIYLKSDEDAANALDAFRAKYEYLTGNS